KEIEIGLQDTISKRDRRGRQPARREIERHMPAMVEPRRQRESQLADDLGTELQPDRSLAPCGPVEVRPCVVMGQASSPPFAFSHECRFKTKPCVRLVVRPGCRRPWDI